MSIYVGNTKIGQMYLGSTEIAQAYLGSTKVYSSASPYDAEVEYLECSGTQYADTDLYGDQTTRLDFDFYSTDTSAARVIAGARNDNTDSISLAFMANAYPTQRYDSKSMAVLLSSGRLLFSVRPDGFYIDNVREGTWSPNSFTTAWTIKLGAGSATSTAMLIGRMYGAKVWKNGVLVGDFIPVRVGQVGYMYDRVSGQLFGNSGSGSFVLGNDV